MSSAGADPSPPPASSSFSAAAAAAAASSVSAAGAAAGAGPSSAAPASSAAAAVAGAPAGSVFVKRAGDVDAVFARVPIFHGDAIADLADRASAKFLWLVGADKIKLFLVPADNENAVATGVEGFEGLVLATRPLSSIKALSAVGISDGCCLLARLPDPPAAAASECARAARSLLSCSQSRGPGRGSRDVQEFRWMRCSRSFATFLLLSSQAAAAAAAAEVAAAAAAPPPPPARRRLSRTWSSFCRQWRRGSRLRPRRPQRRACPKPPRRCWARPSPPGPSPPSRSTSSAALYQ